MQRDIQELPAITGNRGREDKIRLTHLRTRIKYAEIHRSLGRMALLS